MVTNMNFSEPACEEAVEGLVHYRKFTTTKTHFSEMTIFLYKVCTLLLIFVCENFDRCLICNTLYIFHQLWLTVCEDVLCSAVSIENCFNLKVFVVTDFHL